MATAFHHTMRSIKAEGSRGMLAAIAVVLLLLIAWVLWFAFAGVSVYEVSNAAVVEALDPPTTVSSRVAGKVGAVQARLGSRVRAGETLAQLDARASEEKLLSVEQQKRALSQRIAAGGQSDALRHEMELLSIEAGTVRREIEAHHVVAPISGVVTFVAPNLTGAHVQRGAEIATIAAADDDKLHLVAHFPQAVHGRLKVGQPARVRFEAYPWTQFGTVSAVVRAVSTQVRRGSIRVEFDFDAYSGPIALQPGLSGSAEVLLGHASPLVLLLRTIGQLAPPAQTSVAPTPANP